MNRGALPPGARTGPTEAYEYPGFVIVGVPFYFVDCQAQDRM